MSTFGNHPSTFCHFGRVFLHIEVSRNQLWMLLEVYDNLAKGGMGLHYSLLMFGKRFSLHSWEGESTSGWVP